MSKDPAIHLKSVSQAVWAVPLLLAVSSCLGCHDPGPSGGTTIRGGATNDDLARGKLDPQRVACIFAYVYPRPMSHAYQLEDLARCQTVVALPGNESARELLEALAKENTPQDHGHTSGSLVSTGTIRVVLQSKESLYLNYALCEQSQRLGAPPHADGREGASNGSKAWRSWLERYVYPAIDLEESLSEHPGNSGEFEGHP